MGTQWSCDLVVEIGPDTGNDGREAGYGIWTSGGGARSAAVVRSSRPGTRPCGNGGGNGLGLW